MTEPMGAAIFGSGNIDTTDGAVALLDQWTR
jgi:hypothetical protein